MDGETFHDTYTVHDASGRAVWVLSPSASSLLDSEGSWELNSCDALSESAWHYRYDSRGLCVEEKRPGVESVRHAYDLTGSRIFSQDGLLRASGRWSFTLCDRWQRPVLTGECAEESVDA